MSPAAIRESDFVTSIADALQFMSYFHPVDFIRHLSRAYERERSPVARDAIAQILTNSRMCAEGRRPLCQDTGIVNVFLKVGMELRWDTSRNLTELVNEGVRQAYMDPDNPLRASIVADPLFSRRNTTDNTPAVVHMELVPGDKLSVSIAAKGAGSENKARLAMLNPADSVVDWVLESVKTMGAGWCPPGIIGIGVGGTAEKAMLLAKEALIEPMDMQDLLDRGATCPLEHLRIELYEKLNALGIGAQGVGGLTTVLDVKIKDYPTHAASKPVALIPNCAATRHVHFTLDGSGPAVLAPPTAAEWPALVWSPNPKARQVNLNTLTRGEIVQWQVGEALLLTGSLLTARDATHARIADVLRRGESLPAGVNLRDRVIYYVGPVKAVRVEASGPAGPTTASRMDSYTEEILARTGVLAMIGKGERSSESVKSLAKHQAVYLIATGGAAYLLSKAIRASRVVAFAELGMEAMHEFEVHEMPVTVAVDTRGESLHESGPLEWRQRIETMRLCANRGLK